jgi:tetratricopeptide (TPR) repeat protein
LRQAESARAAREFPAAELFTFNALRHDMQNAAAWQLLGRIRQEGGLPGAAPAFAQAFASDSNNLTAGLAAVDAALADGTPAIALPVATNLAALHPGSATLQRAAACLAQTGRIPAALDALKQARALDPADPSSALSLAAVLAGSTNDAQRAEGQSALETLRRDTNASIAASATTSLAASLTRTDPARALALWEERLAAQPDDWTAAVQRSHLRAKLRVTGWELDLATLWASAGTPRQRIDALMLTRVREGSEATLLALDRLPAVERSANAAALIEVATLTDLKRWPEARGLCDSHIKSALEGNARLQFLAWKVRALRGEGDAAGAQSAFDELGKGLATKPALAGVTASLFENWRMFDDATQLHSLAARAQGNSGRASFQRALACAAATSNVTFALDTASQFLGAFPDDPVAANGVACRLLILGRDPRRALQLATQATSVQPNNQNFRETLATALTANGKAAEALSLFEALSPEMRAEPDVQLHHAQALAASGRSDEARTLARQIDSTRLVPEEQARLAELGRD